MSKSIKFSLCIPTMDRYNQFLSKNLPKYLDNEYIDDIVICDENGNDKIKIDKNYNNPKLRTFKNEKKLGPFHNKLKTVSLAKNEWVCLIDSDNFADIDFFKVVNNYILQHEPDYTTIMAPTYAKPGFDYRYMSGWVVEKCTLAETLSNDKKGYLTTAMNTGNYTLNKRLITELDLSKETKECGYAADVIYMNTLFLEQFNAKIVMVPDLEYNHVVHKGSVYLQTQKQSKDFCIYADKRFRELSVGVL